MAPRRRRVLPVSLVAFVGMAGGVPPAAKAEIVINERIGKVALSMTDDQVRARLGRADDITYRSQDFGGPSKTYWYFGRLIVKFYDIEAPRVAWSITTPSQRQRTASGLGVGSRVRTVRSTLTGERCQLSRGRGFCHVIRRQRFGRRTVFQFRRYRVTSVTIRYIY
jgi:hypothetical protein